MQNMKGISLFQNKKIHYMFIIWCPMNMTLLNNYYDQEIKTFQYPMAAVTCSYIKHMHEC